MSRDTKYIGMDVHKEAVVIAVRNSNGQLVMESIVETKARAFCVGHPRCTAKRKQGSRWGGS